MIATRSYDPSFAPWRTKRGMTLGMGMTEKQGGTDVRANQTRAVRDGDAWVVNGNKAWITNPKYAPVIVVLLRTDRDAGSRGFSMMLVETDRPGLTIHPPEKKMGLKGSPTQMLTFENVRVPLDNLLGPEGDGFKQTMQTLDSGRISIGALSVGLAQGAFEEMVHIVDDAALHVAPLLTGILARQKQVGIWAEWLVRLLQRQQTA